MPGRIMTAQQAAKEYKQVEKRGNMVFLKNSTGKNISVSKNTKVYHRGNGKFGLYSSTRDKKRASKGLNQLSPKTKSYKVGKGGYRHTKDGR